MIKNIIFDFGDIFINLDKKAPERALKELGHAKLSEELLTSQLAYEKGLITTENFVALHQREFKNLTSTELVSIWNSILKDTPTYRIDFIKNLAKSKQFRLFLLSNTNELHISWIQQNWGIQRYETFKSCFEQFYLSHEIHLRKPAPDIYEYVLKQNNLIATETLFIDDVKVNTEAAKELGIQVWNLTPGKEDVVDLFKIKQHLF